MVKEIPKILSTGLNQNNELFIFSLFQMQSY